MKSWHFRPKAREQMSSSLGRGSYYMNFDLTQWIDHYYLQSMAFKNLGGSNKPEISCGFQYIDAECISSSNLRFPDYLCSIIKWFDKKVVDLLLLQLIIHSPSSPVMCYVTTTQLPFRVYSALISDTSSVVYTTFASPREVHSLIQTMQTTTYIYITSCTQLRVTTLALLIYTWTFEIGSCSTSFSYPMACTLTRTKLSHQNGKEPGEHAVI